MDLELSMSIFTVFNQKAGKHKCSSRSQLSNPSRSKLIHLKLVISMNKCLLIKGIMVNFANRNSKMIARLSNSRQLFRRFNKKV
jgi:hypothetical protein